MSEMPGAGHIKNCPAGVPAFRSPGVSAEAKLGMQPAAPNLLQVAAARGLQARACEKSYSSKPYVKTLALQLLSKKRLISM